MAYTNPIWIGFGWAQDIGVSGALAGDRFRATFALSGGGTTIVLPDVEPLSDGRVCLRMDGELTGGFAPGAYAWELLLIRGSASAPIADLPPLEACVPASTPVAESDPLAGPPGLPLRASITGSEPSGISLKLQMQVAGPPGPAGPPGGSLLDGTAAVTCSGHRVVRAVAGGVAPASCADPSHAGSVLGVTHGAALAGEPIEFVAFGVMEEPSWTWVPGPLFLGLDGALTQYRPLAGFLQQIGVATAPTRILVNLGLPMILS